MPRQSEVLTPLMKTEASKTCSFAIAFVADSEHLRQLQNMLREVGESLEYQVKFSDGSTRQYRDIEEVLKEPNARARAIVSFSAGVKGRSKQSANIVLSTLVPNSTDEGLRSPSVEYNINGTHKDVGFWGPKLDEWVAGIRQWYSLFYHGVLLFVLMAVVIGGPPSLWKSASPHLLSEAFLKAHSWLGAIFLISSWAAIYWLFKLFPRATFAIGQGARRHHFVQYLRTSVLVAFGVSVLASLLANWLTRHI